MTRTLFLDLQAGISGDMLVASLLDLGVPLGMLQHTVDHLGIGPVSLGVERVRRGPLTALHLLVTERGPAAPGHAHGTPEVEHPHHPPHRPWRDIEALLRGAPLDEEVRRRALAVFTALAEAEAKVHGVPVEEVEFHEVGAVDSIVDIVAACAALDWLGVDRVVAGSVPLGEGRVHSAHGLLPLPAPATLALLAGWPIRRAPGPGEWTTPTGAALLCVLARPGHLEELVLSGVGHGAGTRDDGPVPNVLRAILGEPSTPSVGDPIACDEVEILEAQVDDMPGEWIPPLFEALFAAGALDATVTPVLMKKGRPGFQISALSPPLAAEDVARAMLRHSTTLGVRHWRAPRWVLPRVVETVCTPLGPLRVKRVVLPDGSRRATPEFEDCARIARDRGLPLAEVFAVVQAADRASDAPALLSPPDPERDA